MTTSLRFTLVSFVLFAGFSIALPAWAATLKVTPLGSHDGEFCSRDRALIFEDPNGTRILYDAGRTVAGPKDPRLGKIDIVLVSHMHGDHVGNQHIKAPNAGTCAKPDTPIDVLPNTNSVNIALAKESHIITGSEMPKFFSGKLEAGGDIRWRPSNRFGVDLTINPDFALVEADVETINHVHTGGNSSGIVDGAAAVLVGSKEAGGRMGLKPRARIRAFASIGTEPTIMLTGPAPASKKALKLAGMDASDIDLWELNEAFASVTMAAMTDNALDHDKVNVHGGACALGHPIGASGARILVTLIHALHLRGLSRGVTSLCLGGGEAVAVAVEV